MRLKVGMLTCILLLSINAIPFAQGIQSPSKGRGVYENKEAGFKFTCPPGWFMNAWPSGATFSLYPLSRQPQENVQIQLNCATAPVSFNPDYPSDAKRFGGVEGFLWACKEGFKKEMNASQKDPSGDRISVVQEPVVMMINGMSAVWYSRDITLKKTAPPVLLRIENYDILHKGKWIQIAITASPGDYQTNASIIEAAIKSLTFNEYDG